MPSQYGRFWNVGLLLFVAFANPPFPVARGAEPTTVEWSERRIAGDGLGLLPPRVIWFRSWLKVPDSLTGPGPAGPDLWRDSMTLTVAVAPPGAEVFLNGRKLVDASEFKSAEPLRFKVPRGILEANKYNTLMVRLTGGASVRGLLAPPVFAGYFDEIRFDRPWEFSEREPAPEQFGALSAAPLRAVYRENDFRPATTVLQARPEPVRGKYVSPADALRNLQPENDLIVEELLHEPEVTQPTHLSFDERGRMWVSHYRQYPYPAGLKMISRDKYYRSKYDGVPPAPPNQVAGADVISLHEDRDGDGSYETHRQVLTGLNLANAAVHGHGGLWVMNPPYLMFYPDLPDDDYAHSIPEVRLQGFGLEDTHSVANGLAWGPDGWLYGAQGSTTTSRVTRPGVDATNAPGVYVEGCMVWRCHPEQRRYEIFADGSGNTFGVSFDAEGRLFTGHNGGDTRGWHHIQEGQFLKQGKDPAKFGPVSNPYAFGELPMMRSTHPIPRFSHMTILADGNALPERWRGRFWGIDPLHHFVVAAERRPRGSSFETTDVGYPLRTDDLTFRPVYLANAPDGSVVVADFREEYIAHGQNYQSQIDPFTGRIYRLRGREQPLERTVNLAGKTSAELVELLAHANSWQRQTAVRLLGERRDAAVVPRLAQLLSGAGTHPALEALWVLHQMEALTPVQTVTLLAHPSASVRAWAVRLGGDSREFSPTLMPGLLTLAATEPDAEVRCQLLSSARRLPASQALPLVREVVKRTNDVADPYIPLMAWWVLESHCAARGEAVLGLFDEPAFWRAPLVAEHLVSRLMRRFAAAGTRQDLLACARLLDRAPSADDRKRLVSGFEEAFQGQLLPELPESLLKGLATAGPLSLGLRVRQGDPVALEEVRGQVLNGALPIARRLAAIRVLGEVNHPPAISNLLAVVISKENPSLATSACGSLQRYDAPQIAETLLRAWPELTPGVQSSVLNLLASRSASARLLLDSIVARTVSKKQMTKDILTRLRSHSDPQLARRVEELFPSAAVGARPDLRPRIAEVRRIIESHPGDPYRGEAHFTARCATCHTLFFKGGKVGPDLTSYQRDDLGTMLVSIVDPNAEIREGYENQVLATRDGRTLSGFLVERDPKVVVLRGFDGADVRVPRAEIESLAPAGMSLMPEGVLDGLSESELCDLFAYLRQSQPISN